MKSQKCQVTRLGWIWVRYSHKKSSFAGPENQEMEEVTLKEEEEELEEEDGLILVVVEELVLFLD